MDSGRCLFAAPRYQMPRSRISFDSRSQYGATGRPCDSKCARRVSNGTPAAEGRTRHQLYLRYKAAFSTSSTFCGWSAAFPTRRQCFTTLPFGPTSTVERMTPKAFLPYIIFSP